MNRFSKFFGAWDEATTTDGNVGGSGATPGPGTDTTSPASMFEGTPDPTANPTSTGTTDGHVAGSGAAAQQAQQTQAPVKTTPTTAAVQPGAQTSQQTNQAVLSPQQIAELSAAAAVRTVQQGQRAQQTAAPKALTQEEYNRTFNVAQVDPKVFESVFGYAPEKPEQVQALNNYGQGIARQALTMANALITHEVSKLRGELVGQMQPVASHYQQQVETQLKGEFYTKNPDMAGYEGIIDHISAGILAKGTKFPSKDAAFQFVAGEAKRLLGPAYKAIASPQQVTQGAPQQGASPQQTQQTQRRMAPLSGGGQATGGGSQPATQSGPASIFG